MKTLALFFLSLVWINTAWSAEAEFFGYLRGGTGINLLGGQQECFYNSGIPANFLRLGNECGFYSELGTIFSHKKPSSSDPVYFSTQVRIAYSSKGTRQWEAAAHRDLHQVEAFISAGGLLGLDSQIWVGKRFYRDADLHIFDWYYYGEMSGVGAGIDNLRLGEGSFSIAHLVQAHDDITTDVGRPVLQAIDLRWKNVPMVFKQNLNLWGAFAWAPEGVDRVDDTIEYQSTQGYSLSMKVNGALLGGRNSFALLYGQGAMKDFNIYANSTLLATDSRQNKAWNLRLVEDWHYEVIDRWGILFGFAAEYGELGLPEHATKLWYQVGLRPIYFLTDRFQWVLELGYSTVRNDSEQGADGSAVGERNLYRVTLAPQISLNKSVWGRPVLRAFLSHTGWSGSNKSFVGREAPTFLDKTSGTSFGYQFEAWF